MKKIILLLLIPIAILVACNIVVILVSKGRCYSDIDQIPTSYFGILLGTGRSEAPSPYYDARVQAAIELYQAEKIQFIIISGENDEDGYREVYQMWVDIKAVIPNARIIIDDKGSNTWASLINLRDMHGCSYSVTIISQEFHNQRAIFLGSLLFYDTPIAYNARDTHNAWWKVRNSVREWFARTKEVILAPIRICM